MYDKGKIKVEKNLKKRGQEQSQHTKYMPQMLVCQLWAGHKFNSKF